MGTKLTWRQSQKEMLSVIAGLPRVLVDVRHEAAHNELPSLPLLRLAAVQALAWLRDYYWDRQSQSLQAAQNRVQDLIKVNRLHSMAALFLCCLAVQPCSIVHRTIQVAIDVGVRPM